MRDSDESVAQGAEGLVVQVAGGAVLIVEGAGAEAGGQGAEGPLVDRVIETPVADVTGHSAFFARRDGQW